MSNGISKYKHHQESGAARDRDRKNSGKKSKVLKKKKSLLIESHAEAYEDKLTLSDEAEEKIMAAESLAESTYTDDTENDDLVENTLINNEVSKESIKEIKSVKETLGTKDEIVVEYAPLIKYIAQKIAARLPSNIELDDLISSGVIGLMDAIDKYDPTRDNKFKTYAEFRIRGAILDELRSQDWVPRSVREKAKVLERAFVKLEHENGKVPTDEELCEYLKISQAEYHDLLNQVRSISLLSYEDLASMSKGDRRLLQGISDGGHAQNPFSEVNVAHVKQVIANAIKDLPEKQRLVLSLYYYEDLNLKEIGKVLDVTESRVSQLHTQAVIRLKAKLRNYLDDFLLMMT